MNAGGGRGAGPADGVGGGDAGAAASSSQAVPADCTVCGVCCWSDDARYLRVFAVDEARMGAAARPLTHQLGGRRFMRLGDGRCAALRGEVAAVGAAVGGAAVGGASRQMRWRCAIYPERPDCCRWLERGSGACRELLAAGAGGRWVGGAKRPGG